MSGTTATTPVIWVKAVGGEEGVFGADIHLEFRKGDRLGDGTRDEWHVVGVENIRLLESAERNEVSAGLQRSAADYIATDEAGKDAEEAWKTR